MLPARMKSVRIITHDDFVKPLVKTLHNQGILEIEDVRKIDTKSDVLDIPADAEDAKKCSDLCVRLEKIIAILKASAKAEDGGIKAMIRPPLDPVYPVKEKNFNQLVTEAEKVLDRLERKVLDSEKLFSNIDEEVDELEKQRENVQIASILDFDLSILANGGESEYLMMKLGMSTDPVSLGKLFKGMDVELFSKPTEDGTNVVLMVFHIDDRENYRNKVSRDLFQEMTCGNHFGKPTAVIKDISGRMAKAEAKKTSVLNEMEALYKLWEIRLITIKEGLSIELEKQTVLSKFGKTASTTTIFGWCPTKQEAKLRETVVKTTKGHSVLLTSDPVDENVPILLRNPGWARPFEALTEMFATPKYGEVDPTIFIAPLFVFFFGLMLGDAIYGIMVLAAGIVLLKGMGRVNSSMRDFGIILSAIGVSTIVIGSLLGGFMGPLDEKNPMTALFSLMGYQPHIILDPMADPIVLLQISLYIGLIHINLGLLLGAYQNIHGRKWKALVQDQISWFVLEPCAALWIYKFFGWGTFPQLWMDLSSIGILVGMGLIFAKKGPLGFFDITGFLGNWLSYARLLALGLATTGIALTVNIILGMILSIELNWICCSTAAIIAIALLALGLMKQNPTLKYLSYIMLPIAIIGLFNITLAFYIVGAIIFVGVHIGNALLQALGAFIHSLRLQYVEFFGQFYEGGGRKFDPFKLTREFTVLKEADK